MSASQRAIYGGTGTTADAVELEGDQDVAGEKTFLDLLTAADDAQLGPDANNLRVGALGDTSGVWIDAVLGSGNPNVSVNIRAKGPSGRVNLLSPTDLTVVDGEGQALTSKVDGDTGRRFKLAADGGMSWGDGTDEDLANLYRVGTELHTDSTVDVAGLKIAGTAAGTAATKNVGTTSGTVAAGDDSRITGAAQKASNLGDLANTSTARSNLGLGNVDNTADTAKPVSTAQQTALDAKQPLDSDLTAIAALTPTNDDVVQRKAGAWTNRTPAQLKTDLVLVKGDVGLGNVDNTADTAKPVSTAQQTALDAKQPLDSDLTAIAALTPSNDDIVQRKAGAWTNRTIAQLKTDLAYGSAALLTAGGANGAATLDSGSKLTRSQVPILGTVRNDLVTDAYWGVPGFGSTQSVSMTANRAYAVPFILSVDGTLADFGIENTAVATAGNVRAGIYTSSGARPANRIVDLGQVAAPSSAADMMWWTVSQALTAGVQYWGVIVAQGLTGSPTFRQRNTNTNEVHFGTSRPTTLGGSFAGVYSDTGFSGALPSSFGAVAGVVASPALCIKVAA
jgi:hypothetical protein